jgi:transposase
MPGIGPVLTAVIVAESGVVIRLRTAAQLCRWAELTPRHREPELKVARGHVTKQGRGSCEGINAAGVTRPHTG